MPRAISVIPAKAGIQGGEPKRWWKGSHTAADAALRLGPRLRGDDELLQAICDERSAGADAAAARSSGSRST